MFVLNPGYLSRKIEECSAAPGFFVSWDRVNKGVLGLRRVLGWSYDISLS